MATGVRVSQLSSLLALLSVALGMGCATTRYVSAPAAPPPELGISSNDENLSVTVDSLIVPNGPGSWVKGARWDEYQLTIRNLSNERTTIMHVRLIDPRGLYIDSGADPWQLERTSEMLAEEYKTAGLSMVVGTAPALITGLAATSGSVGGAMAAATAAPFVGLAAPFIIMGSEVARWKDREHIQDEFNERQLGTHGAHFTLSGDATITGSVFFPLIPNPRALVIDYSLAQDMASVKSLEVTLEKLEGLHVAVPPALQTSPQAGTEQPATPQGESPPTPAPAPETATEMGSPG